MITAQPIVVAPRRTKVRAPDLARVIDDFGGKLRVLSLDCFDTIVWRQVATPIDLFYDLQEHPAFKRLGYNAKLRVSSESAARQMKVVRTGRSEVTLAEIYREAFPALTDAEVAELSEAELEAEIRTCYAFPAALDLMRAAARKNLKIIIVSDTYFSEAQLRRLLAATLPPDVNRAIDRVFTSSAHGLSKTQGLHLKALERMRQPPRAVLHVGDNEAADLSAASRAGLNAVHFVHHDPWLEEMNRLQATATNLLAPSVRENQSMPMPFRGLLVSRFGKSEGVSAVDVLGYAGAGPLLYAFGRYILDEIASLRAMGKRVKPLFLLRDGYLPKRVCDAIAGAEAGDAVAISRFVSYAASFRSDADVERYLAKSVGSGRFESLGRQLLLTPAETAAIIERAERAKSPVEEFVRQIRQPDTLRTIIERSGAMRARLFRYLEVSCGLEAGDTLLFIDLGYEGTAQRQLEPVFRDERGVEIQGRYLLASRTPGWERSRGGLLDPSWCDDRALASLVTYIALIEDLCTSDDGSVVDYTAEGAPVRDSRVLDADQYEKIKPLQARCVEFALDAERFFAASGKRPTASSLRTAALGALGRLLFTPSEPEVSYLEGFRLDMNLATRDSYALFDRDEGLAGLRRRGMFFMEHGQRTLRMNYPIELRSAGLELSLTLLAQHRYALEFSRSDMTLRRESLGVLVARGGDASMHAVEASATHDGFFSLIIPAGTRDLSLGVMFGRSYTWVQIESVHLIEVGHLYGRDESLHTEDVSASAHTEHMVERGPGILECTSESAFLFVAPPPKAGDRASYVCRVVFRPLALREQQAQ
ncbi:MAG: HAD family hydrolase [Polyangiales bacterium]